MTRAIPDRASAKGDYMPIRVGFLNSHPIQYVAPLYRYFAENAEDIEPVAIYLSDFSMRGAVDQQFGQKVTWDVDLLSGYEHHFVGPDYRTLVPGGFRSLVVPQVAKEIRTLRLDALVLHGHGYAADLIALTAAKLSGIPVLYKGETHLDLPRGAIKGALRRPVLGALYSQIDHFLAIGSKNAAFYRSFGVPKDKISHYPYTVENERFIAASRVSHDERQAIYERYDLSPDLPTVIYASKFMPRKRPDDLFRAAEGLAGEGLMFNLLLVGTGEMEGALRQMASANPAVRARFTGFINQSALPKILGASDIFVLPSENEPFGLIINEAMCAGLPIVASREIGCVGDLVQPGRNGNVFESGDIAGLADALRPLIVDTAERARMGEQSRAIIDKWSYRENLSGLRDALGRIGVGPKT